MVLSCPACHCSKIIADDESQAFCCTDCGLVFDTGVTLQPQSPADTARQALENSTNDNDDLLSGANGHDNRSRCVSAPHLLLVTVEFLSLLTAVDSRSFFYRNDILL